MGNDDDFSSVEIIFFRTIRRLRRGTTPTTGDACFNVVLSSSSFLELLLLSPSFIFVDGWNAGFTHACDGAR